MTIEELEGTHRETIKKKQEELRESIILLETEERTLKGELQEEVKSIRIEQSRTRSINQDKIIKKFLGVWSQYSGFKTQTEYFYRDLEVWKSESWREGKPELFHKKEVAILHSINRQFVSCIRILNNELIADQLNFRTNLEIWKEKVDKKLKALGKKQ